MPESEVVVGKPARPPIRTNSVMVPAQVIRNRIAASPRGRSSPFRNAASYTASAQTGAGDEDALSKAVKQQKMATAKEFVLNEKSITFEDEAIAAKPALMFDVIITPQQEDEFRAMEKRVEEEYLRLRSDYIRALPNDGWADNDGGWGEPCIKHAGDFGKSAEAVVNASPETLPDEANSVPPPASRSRFSAMLRRMDSLAVLTTFTVAVIVVCYSAKLVSNKNRM